MPNKTKLWLSNFEFPFHQYWKISLKILRSGRVYGVKIFMSKNQQFATCHLLTSSLSLKYKATITTELSNIREKSCETFANDKAKF